MRWLALTAVIFAFLTASGSADRTRIITDGSSRQDCPGLQCPGGCCLNADYVCCSDPRFCAEFPEECPSRVGAAHFFHVTDIRRQDCPGVQCPGGCCLNEGYVCCDDPRYCAENADECPAVKSNIVVIEEDLDKQDCPGIQCPGGCCLNEGFICCDDPRYCAEFESECPAL